MAAASGRRAQTTAGQKWIITELPRRSEDDNAERYPSDSLSPELGSGEAEGSVRRSGESRRDEKVKGEHVAMEIMDTYLASDNQNIQKTVPLGQAYLDLNHAIQEGRKSRNGSEENEDCRESPSSAY